MVKLIAGLVAIGFVCGAAFAQSSAAVTGVSDGMKVPALEPAFTVQEAPEWATAPTPIPRMASASTPLQVDRDADRDHVARLMAGRLHCGDVYPNDVGGLNAECVAVLAR